MAKDFLKSDPIGDLEAQLNRDFNKVIRAAHKSLGTKTHSPVYTVYSLNDASTVLIHPDCNGSGQVGRIWSFAYAVDTDDLTTITTSTSDLTNSFKIGNVLCNPAIPIS